MRGSGEGLRPVMSGYPRALIILALVLMPLLAWSLVAWYGRYEKARTLRRQQDELASLRTRTRRMIRQRFGIQEGRPFQLPFSFEVVDPSSPLRTGQWALWWHASLSPQWWDAQNAHNWRALLREQPQLVLTAIFQKSAVEDIRSAVPADLPVGKGFASGSALSKCGVSVGTFWLIDDRGIVRYVGELKGRYSPAPEDRALIKEVIGGSQG